MKIDECFFIDNDVIKNILISYPSFKYENNIIKYTSKEKYEGESNNYYKIIKLKKQI